MKYQTIDLIGLLFSVISFIPLCIISIQRSLYSVTSYYIFIISIPLVISFAFNCWIIFRYQNFNILYIGSIGCVYVTCATLIYKAIYLLHNVMYFGLATYPSIVKDVSVMFVVLFIFNLIMYFVLKIVNKEAIN